MDGLLRRQVVGFKNHTALATVENTPPLVSCSTHSVLSLGHQEGMIKCSFMKLEVLMRTPPLRDNSDNKISYNAIISNTYNNLKRDTELRRVHTAEILPRQTPKGGDTLAGFDA